MEGRPGKGPVHDRLYQDYFDRRTNHELLLRHLSAQGRTFDLSSLCPHSRTGNAGRLADEDSVQDERIEDWRKKVLMQRQDARLKVPTGKESIDAFEPRRPTQALSPQDPNSLPTSPRKPASFTPLISKYYSQLTPFTQTVSYEAGCDRKKILKSGKQMIRYTDSRAMFEALSQGGRE